MDEVSGPSVGQTASVDMFDSTGRRLRLNGRISWVDAGTLVVALAAGDRVLGAPSGTQAMVECRDDRGNMRFMSTVLEFKLEKGLQVVLEAPPYVARLQSRKFTRHGLRARVGYLVEGEPVRERRTAMTEDLGGNGVRLATDRVIGIGAHLTLDIDLEGASCTGTGQVKHVNRGQGADRATYLWGVEFTAMDAPNLARLWAFLRAHAVRVRAGPQGN